MISEDSVPTYLVIGEKLQVPKDVVFDIFDLKPTLEVSLKDADGQMTVDLLSHSLKVSVQKGLISYLKTQPELEYKIN